MKKSQDLKNFNKSLLNHEKVTGLNNILTKVFKVFEKTISIPPGILINLVFECSIFRNSLKFLSVTLIHRKGDYLD